MALDRGLEGVGGQRLGVAAPDDRLDRHLIVARVVMAAQPVLGFGRGELQTEPRDHVQGDVVTGVERARVVVATMGLFMVVSIG